MVRIVNPPLLTGLILTYGHFYSMDARDLAQINVLAELDRAGIRCKMVGETEVLINCPFHDDKTPSCSISLEKRLFVCRSPQCGATGDFITLLSRMFQVARGVIWTDLCSRYPIGGTTKRIDRGIVEKYAKDIWNAPPLLRALRDRGIDDDTIRRNYIGCHKNRITIPIFDEYGLCINVRRYLPGAPADEKFQNTQGFGSPIRLYPIAQLTYDHLVICGGELKALAVAQRLNDRGVGAISTTHGEGSWRGEFNKLLSNKIVWLCFDVDDAGVRGAESVAARIAGVAGSVWIVELPLDRGRYPTGDVNDYFGSYGANGDDFVKLLETARQYTGNGIQKRKSADVDATRISLAQAPRADLVGSLVEVDAVVASMVDTPYAIPKKVLSLCDRSQNFCSECPIYDRDKNKDGWTELELDDGDQALLEMIASPRALIRDAIMRGLQVPPCKIVQFKTITHTNIEEVRLSPKLDMSLRTADTFIMPAYIVGSGIELNDTYTFKGRTYPHPKTQACVLFATERKSAIDGLSGYQVDPAEIQQLIAFQPDTWTYDGVIEKVGEIYADFEANVTKIFQRPRMHAAVDLAYHSPLEIRFDGKSVKGWVETLIVGDSAQGKSETATRLMEHYGLGECVDCKNASVAGLLGGMQQISGRFMVSWGKIPRHDRRLVILEELKGASVEVISKLTGMRSTGVAELPKIEQRKTHARTRIVAISNPRRDKSLASYSFGIDAIKELIGSLEDIRRFDFICLTAASQVDAREINKLASERKNVPHRFTSDLCRKLVLWAWTRTANQIHFDTDSQGAILNAASALCEEYTDDVPIVDRGSMRHKLARLAASLACRTFSADDGINLIVRQCHVEAIVSLLREEYSAPEFGYKDFTDAVNMESKIIDPQIIEERITTVPFPRDFVEQLLRAELVEVRDFCDWLGWPRESSVELLSLLVRKHALLRDGKGYKKNSHFITLLKQLKMKDLGVGEPPGYIQDQM